MSCSPFDLRDYFLRELTDSHQRQQVEAHLKGCAPCREELERLQLTEAALMTLREEDIPQRISFVSDKVFEPSPLRRWLDGFWNSSARLGFASAAMLSTALIVFAATRPAPAPAPLVHTVAAVAAAPDSAEIARQVQAAADRAAQAIEARYAQKTEQLVRAIELRDQKQRQTMAASFDMQSNYYGSLIERLRLENRTLLGNSAQLREGEVK